MNKIVNDFSNVDTSELKIPVIAVFFNTIDFPNKYVARIFDVQRPTNVVVIKETLEEIREVIPKDLIRVERQAGDHPTLIETWL